MTVNPQYVDYKLIYCGLFAIICERKFATSKEVK